MLLTVRTSSYGCTWEVWRALKKLELLSAAPRATLTLLSCSPNFPRASITRCTHAKHEPIVNEHGTKTKLCHEMSLSCITFISFFFHLLMLRSHKYVFLDFVRFDCKCMAINFSFPDWSRAVGINSP